MLLLLGIKFVLSHLRVTPNRNSTLNRPRSFVLLTPWARVMTSGGPSTATGSIPDSITLFKRLSVILKQCGRR